MILQFISRWIGTDNAAAAPAAARDATANIAPQLAATRSLLEQGNAEQALTMLREVANLAPAADVYELTGRALQQLGRLEEALHSVERALDLQPDHVPALTTQAGIHLEREEYREAEDCCNLALAFAPESSSARSKLGAIMWRHGRRADAMALLRRVMAEDAESVEARFLVGTYSLELKRYAEALECFHAAAALRPFPELLVSKGMAHHRLEQLPEAIACYERALEMRPQYAAAQFNLDLARAETFRLSGLFKDAEACLRRALAHDPANAQIHTNLGSALAWQARYDEAVACFEQVLTLDRFNVEANMNLGIVRLAQGDLAAGWAGHEWRFRQHRNGWPAVFQRPVGVRPWDGQPLAGKRLLILGEQGIGDEIFFSSMYPEVIASCGSCVIECAPKLVPLFQRSFGEAEVVPRTDPPHALTRGDFDFHQSAGSLAQWLRPTLASFPLTRGHLVPDDERVAYWRSRLNALGGGPKVGFSWRSMNVEGDRGLHCTSIEQWASIFAVPGAHFICLQYDECQAELQRARDAFRVPLHFFPEVDLFNDLDEAAALTRALDLVITAPTAAASLAGAVGVETWQMNFGPDWEMHGRTHTPWYARMKTYWRRWDSGWDPLIGQVAKDLDACVQSTQGDAGMPLTAGRSE